MHLHRRNALVCALAVLTTTSIARADQPLSPARLEQLRRLPIPVLVPAVVPPARVTTFVVANLRVKGESDDLLARGYGYHLDMVAPHARVTIDEATSGFGASEPDYRGIRRPFTVVSAALGPARFTPQGDARFGWCYNGTADIPGAKAPADGGSPPSFLISACGMERPAIEAMMRSFHRVEARRTAVPR